MPTSSSSSSGMVGTRVERCEASRGNDEVKLVKASRGEDDERMWAVARSPSPVRRVTDEY